MTEFRPDDYGLLCAALIKAVHHKLFTRSQRERLLKLRRHFQQLAADAEDKKRIRREQRQKVVERRAARRMPSVSREEADDWHKSLGGR